MNKSMVLNHKNQNLYHQMIFRSRYQPEIGTIRNSHNKSNTQYKGKYNNFLKVVFQIKAHPMYRNNFEVRGIRLFVY